MISEARKPLQLVGQAAQFKFESKFESLPHSACHLVISLKAVPGGNRRFRGRNQRPSSWGRSPALLARVGWASTNTGRFRVCCSRCWPRQARLRKTCYHSWDHDTEAVQEPIRFQCFLNLGPRRVTFFFFMWHEISIESARSCCRPRQRPSLR